MKRCDDWACPLVHSGHYQNLTQMGLQAPSFDTKCATAQQRDKDAINFVTAERCSSVHTVHIVRRDMLQAKQRLSNIVLKLHSKCAYFEEPGKTCTIMLAVPKDSHGRRSGHDCRAHLKLRRHPCACELPEPPDAQGNPARNERCRRKSCTRRFLAAALLSI